MLGFSPASGRAVSDPAGWPLPLDLDPAAIALVERAGIDQGVRAVLDRGAVALDGQLVPLVPVAALGVFDRVRVRVSDRFIRLAA